jgi:hypothetical protein
MIKDLIQFAGIWVLVILMFSSVSVLLFGSLPTFRTLTSATIYWLQAIMGNFSMKTMIGNDPQGNPMVELENLGIAYTFLFLIVNLVLMFNFVIAILGNTYSTYCELSLGLFNNNLNLMFDAMEWDEEYGALMTTKLPQPAYFFVIISAPFYKLISSLRPQYLKRFNSILAILQYIPISLIIVALFTAGNMAIIPIAYLINFSRLF